MARGVAVAVQRGDAGGQGIACDERSQAPGRGIRRHRAARHREGETQCLRRAGFAGRVQPVAGIGLRQPHRGVGERRLAVGVEQPAQVVRVGVGQQHVVDLGRVIAGGAQVGQYLAQAGAEALRGPGIDQRQVATALYQVGVDRGLQALAVLGHVAVLEQAGDHARGNAGQRLPRQGHGAVEQRGYAHVADLLVIHAGDLCARDMRGAGVGAGGGQQQGQGEGAKGSAGHGRFRQGRHCRGAAMLPPAMPAMRSECGAIRSPLPRRQWLPMADGSIP